MDFKRPARVRLLFSQAGIIGNCKQTDSVNALMFARHSNQFPQKRHTERKREGESAHKFNRYSQILFEFVWQSAIDVVAEIDD